MADTVQYLLEESIPELEDYEKKGYFNKSEIKQIVKKRQDFEYLLKRRAALKQDFLRYINYEMKLEELRKHRRKLAGIKGKKSIADVGIIRRIHFIYERATRKFKSDLQLWMDWIKFCKHRHSSKQLSKVITKGLQRHATVPALWIEAAACNILPALQKSLDTSGLGLPLHTCREFEHNSNVAAARSLMQQGLRMCKHVEAMWIEYFRMELLYLHKLRSRRAVLGIDNPDTSSAPAEAEEDASNAAVRAVLTGAIAKVVYKNAIAAIPVSLMFRKKFLDTLKPFQFPGMQDLESYIYSSIEADFPRNEEAWDVQARRHLGPAAAGDKLLTWDAEAHSRVVAVYGRAQQALPTARMYEVHAAYLVQVLELLMALQGSEHAESVASVGAELLSLLHHAHTAQVASEGLYLQWIAWAKKLAQPMIALKAARQACARHPSSAALWLQRIQLELDAGSAQRQDPVQLLKAAVAAVPAAQAEDIWMLVLGAVRPGSAEFDSIVDLLVECLHRWGQAPVAGGMGAVAATILNNIRECQGLSKARALYRRLSSLSPGGDFFAAAVAMERAASEQGTSSSQHVVPIFEAAIAAYGALDTDLWLTYAEYLASQHQGVGPLYWRATKALHDPAEFIRRYHEVHAAHGSM